MPRNVFYIVLIIGFFLVVIMFFIVIVGRRHSQYDFHVAENMELFSSQYKEVQGADANRLSLDIYTNPDFESKPVIIYVHGGALRTGNKANDASYLAKSNYFVSNKYIYVSINYRLSPDVVFPTHIEDVADAFMYVYENIVNYGGNPDEIYIMGHSAGAYLVSLLATNEKYLENAGGNLTMIKGVISLDTGAYISILRGQEEIMPSEPLKRFNAVPGNHVEEDKGIPPFLILYSDQRQKSAVESVQLGFTSLLLENAISAAAIECTGCSHASVNRDIGQIEDKKLK